MPTTNTEQLERAALRAVADAGGSMNQSTLVGELLQNITFAEAKTVLGCCVGNGWLNQYRVDFASFLRHDLTPAGRARLAELEGK